MRRTIRFEPCPDSDGLGLVVGLRDVSFSVDTGQIFVVMGLSGSGKSTPHRRRQCVTFGYSAGWQRG